MRLHDQGEDVRQLQRALLARGFDLPRYGADGDFGAETAAALASFAKSIWVLWLITDPVPDALLAALGSVDEPAPKPPSDGPLELGVPLYDLRGEQTNPHPKGRQGRDGLTIVRAPAQITGVMLHQAGIKFPGAGIKLARRSLGVACHAMAFPGFLAWPAELLWYINHGNGGNAWTLGLEVDGHYPGRIGRQLPRRKDGTRPEATPMFGETIEAGRAGVRLLVEEGRRLGCPIEFLYAHRQFDAWRRADPGEWIWREVGLEYAVRVLGLEIRPAETWPHHEGPERRGLPVPEAWGPGGVGKY